jgi:hypothetical protein
MGWVVLTFLRGDGSLESFEAGLEFRGFDDAGETGGRG